MKPLFKYFICFLKKEWFLLVMLTVIALLFLLFELF